MRNIRSVYEQEIDSMKCKLLVLCLLLIYSLNYGVLAETNANLTATSKPPAEQVASSSGKTTSSTTGAHIEGSSRQNGANSTSVPGEDLSNEDADETADMSGSASALSSRVSAATRQLEEDQATSPTVTSVQHQVWTSSSSGSLDELSPELIAKLRGADVPFLAAYALRPRLVGASLTLPVQSAVDQSSRNNDDANLQTSASQQQQQRQSSSLLAGGQLAPKLGDFSELKVETSSTSKSEHHHKRKTTLKKQQPSLASSAGRDDDSFKRRRLILAATSRLMRERKRTKKSLAGSTLPGKQRRGNRKQSKRLKSRAGRLRTQLDGNNRRHHLSIIRHGRQQRAPVSPALNSLPEGKTTINDPQAIDDDGVKGGGSRKSAGAEPFYKRRKQEEPIERTATSTNDLGAQDEVLGERPSPKEADGAAPADAEADDGEGDGAAQLEPPEPRRVGDPDVDEVEGDTVTVVPKFDGVDDDPEIPIEDSEAPGGAPVVGNREPAGARDENPSREREADGSPSSIDDNADGDGDGEPRGGRVNRAKSLPGGQEASGGSDGNSMVAGAGIGATTGSAPDDEGLGDGSDDGGTGAADAKGLRSSPRVEPGVEFADEEKNKAEGRVDAPAGSGDEDLDYDERRNGGEFDSRRVASAADGGESASGGRRADDDDGQARGEKNRGRDDDAGDVDYRDEMAATRSSKAGGSRKTTDQSSETDSRETHDYDEAERKVNGGHHDEGKDRGGSHGHHDEQGKSPDCNEHHDEHGHHHHHDGIKWLEEAIPGEPGQDYPILNRVNLTAFDCRDQKYAGYYADVEARCQVFHICQADGRQDSFLDKQQE